MGSLSIWHWLIVLAIVVLVFGTKKLRNLGGDLGGAIKNFKGAMKEGDAEAEENLAKLSSEAKTETTEQPAREKTEA